MAAWSFESMYNSMVETGREVTHSTGLDGVALSDHELYVEDDETLLQAGQWRLLRFMHPASDGWIASSVAAAPKTAAVLRTIPALRECAARDSCYDG